MDTLVLEASVEAHHNQLQQEQQGKHEHQISIDDMTGLPENITEEIVTIPKEVILISLVSQEQSLYNPKDENYRNTQCKDAKWLSIADNIGWTESQAKCKWKALRDQYCRELKRSKFNAKANVKWKYFKELDFLRPYALSRHYRPRNYICIDSLNATINNNNNNSSGGSANNSISESPKFPTIKIEGVSYHSLEFNANDSSTEQLDNVMQQPQQQQDGNWNYLSATGNTADNNNLQNEPTTTNNSDEALYSAFVDCVAAAAVGQMAQGPTHSNQDEEDDDPIHTFLNIESYFEKELIAIIQQEDILYNSCHPQYRNIKQKMEVWDEISRKLKRTVRQCRLKWKALRDQYIREHKRLKNRDHVEALPRWKHYDALNFLHKFIKHKTDECESKHKTDILKREMEIDDEQQNANRGPSTTPLQSPELQVNPLALQNMPVLSGPHDQQHQQLQDQQQIQVQQLNDNTNSLCLVDGTATSYDPMDIEDYIGCSNESHTVGAVDGDDSVVQKETDDDIDRKSPRNFVLYAHQSNSSKSNMNSIVTNSTANDDEEFKDIKSTASQDSLIERHLHQQHKQHHKQALAGIIEAVTPAADEILPKLCHTEFKTEAPENIGPAATDVNGISFEDDEVGAFFKAVAMKIRNAKMSPIAFTDLQIDILRVINSSLRPH